MMSTEIPPAPFYVSLLHVDDIPDIMVIERASFSLPWTPTIYRYELKENAFARYLGIRSRHEALPRLVAYGGLWLYLPEAHVSTIAVHPLLRGLHLGAWMLAVLLVEAVQEGAHEATLEVRVSNRVAQRLYRSFGFRVVGRRPRYYSDNKEDAYVMTLRPLDRLALMQRLHKEEQTVRQRWHERKETVVAQFTTYAQP